MNALGGTTRGTHDHNRAGTRPSPGAGWIAFDPTHGRLGQGVLITVAGARSNAQIMPVAGSYVVAPDALEAMEVEIRVTACGATNGRGRTAAMATTRGLDDRSRI
jgi:hypothetical protein